ncbi:hypothetical protein BTZ20_0283 [Rhodococcus sp. MTM3W5.2]|nr:hypothetical protein BTZ20_0283 [Rhodococcus sp. MTM3W5.2]
MEEGRGVHRTRRRLWRGRDVRRHPVWLDRGVGIGLIVFCATRANVYVYEKKVLGKHTWSL